MSNDNNFINYYKNKFYNNIIFYTIYADLYNMVLKLIVVYIKGD